MTTYRVKVEAQVHEVEADSESDAVGKVVAILKHTVEVMDEGKSVADGV